jgi:hypothetical protein
LTDADDEADAAALGLCATVIAGGVVIAGGGGGVVGSGEVAAMIAWVFGAGSHASGDM